MSSTTGKKATPATPAKAKKRSSRKKVAKTSPRKTRGSSTTARKKVVKKKPVTKKTAAKKPATRKVAKKTAGSKKAATTPRKKTTRPKQEDTKSLSWMSAQAASALKAVKASQAEKGQTILARTRKQPADKTIDDESLIEIAADMPVDNDGLIEFSTEEPVEEQSRQIEAPLTAPEPAREETSSPPDTSGVSAVEAEAETERVEEVVEAPVEPAPQQEPGIQAPVPPPQPAKRSVLFHPALAAGILLSLVLGYYFWPNGDDTNTNKDSAAVATQENTVIETATVVAEPDPVEPVVTLIEEQAIAPAAEPEQEAPESINALTPAGVPGTRAPSDHPQTAAVPPTPEPKAEPAPVTPPQPTVTQQTPPPAQPAAPAQRNYTAPVYGSYPQQRQPAYPQRYYR